jgi:N-acetylneuraminic acid mutarotase
VSAGQSLVHQYLTPTGDTYWVQMQSSPTPIAGTTISINDTAPTKDRYNLSIVEVLSASTVTVTPVPPTVSISAPVQGMMVAISTTVSASVSDNVPISSVQFLLDGVSLGSPVTAPPYSVTWDTTTAANGPHTLSARAQNSAGQMTTSSPVSITVDNTGNPAVTGNWSAPVSLPAVAVNLILLPNNQVLFYQDGSTPTVWNYVTNAFTNVPVFVNLFCSGAALLADGRILVVGGYGNSSNDIGVANAEIFDPSTNHWTPVPNMAFRRWYPTATTLADGRILVTAGWQTTAHSNAGVSEIYDPSTNTWSQLTNANNPFETYPFLYQLNDGRIIHIGGSEYATETDILDINAQTWTVVDGRVIDGASATMFAPGKFMKAGAATDSQGIGPGSNTTFVLDVTQPNPAWQQTAPMAYPRSFLNLTMLPDGTVLATGGATDKNGGTIANAVYAAERWSPQTQTWTTMASMHTPREYHGTALLLPDGRVLESGMGADFGNVPDQRSAEFYSPPYLFKGPRPTITQVPSQISYGTNFTVTTPDAASIQSVVLIRTGAVTHFFDQNERYVPLAFQQTAGGLTVTAPANGNAAPPGFYMLFIVNSNGVPSIAPFVQVH